MQRPQPKSQPQDAWPVEPIESGRSDMYGQSQHEENEEKIKEE